MVDGSEFIFAMQPRLVNLASNEWWPACSSPALGSRPATRGLFGGSAGAAPLTLCSPFQPGLAGIEHLGSSAITALHQNSPTPRLLVRRSNHNCCILLGTAATDRGGKQIRVGSCRYKVKDFKEVQTGGRVPPASLPAYQQLPAVVSVVL